MENDQQHQVANIPDFDVLSENPEKCAMVVRDKLVEGGYKKVRLVQHTSLGEVIPAHVEISINGDIIALIYKPIACHGYNKIEVSGKTILVATIDTMLSFYLAFLYADKAYFDKDRMLCMASYLFEVEQKNKLEQKGLLKRFSLDCYGKQPTMEDMRAEKAKKYAELKGSTSTKDKQEFERWFFKYIPSKNAKLQNRIVRKNTNSSPTKTRVINSNSNATYSIGTPKYSIKATAKRKRRKPNKTESGPYTKRQFYFNKPR